MPKKKSDENPKDQSERFKKAVHELVDAGQLDPEEADNALDRVVRRAKEPPPA